MELEIHDTSGDEQLGVNRTVQFNNADIFMLCVAADSPRSLTSVDKWLMEIRTVSDSHPIVLVQTKSDLEKTAVEAVTYQMLKDKAQLSGCV